MFTRAVQAALQVLSFRYAPLHRVCPPEPNRWRTGGRDKLGSPTQKTLARSGVCRTDPVSVRSTPSASPRGLRHPAASMAARMRR
jgi:hypothetical protein